VASFYTITNMAPPHNVLNLLAVMSESILLGSFTVLTVLVVWLLISRRRTMPTMHKVLFWASIIMFLISVVHLALVVQQSSVAKLLLANERTRVALATAQFMIGDLVLIWRVWVVWGRNYWIALGPLMIMIAAVGLSINTIARPVLSNVFIVVSSALVVTNTTICTFLIAGRIWYAHYDARRTAGGKVYGASGVPRTVILFIETGALYTTAQVTSLILNRLNSPGIHILLDLQIPLIGILPTLIIVLVHFDLGSSGKSHSSRSHTILFEGRGITQLDTLGTATAHSEGDISTGRPKSKVYVV